jgi:hypothetical protein
MSATVQQSDLTMNAGDEPRLGTRLALGAIRWYQAALSPLLWSACRYCPSCSEYTHEAIGRYGVARGVWLGCKRLLRCHPFAKRSGYDPVPEREDDSHEVRL